MKDALSEAFDALGENRVAESGNLFEVILRQNPSCHQAAYGLGLSLIQSGSLKRGLGFLRAATLIKPDEPEYLHALADTLVLEGSRSESLEFYEKALILAPDNWKCRQNYGTTFQDMKDHEKAIDQFRIVCQLRPDLTAAWNNLALSLMETGLYEEAIVNLRTALELEPGHISVLINLAKAFNETAQYTDAERSARLALESEPNSAGALLQLGRSQLEQSKLVEAEFSLHQSLSSQSNSSALTLLGTIAEQRGDLDAALKFWNQALAIRPDHARLLGHMANRLRAQLPSELEKRIHEILTRPSLNLSDKEHLACGLAHVADSRSEYDSAAYWLDKSCDWGSENLKLRGHSYDAAAFLNHVRQIQCLTMDRLPNVVERSGSGYIPVFIVGMPRSGTSLLEQVLASHSQITGLGELRWMPDIVERMLSKHLKRSQKSSSLHFESEDLAEIRHFYHQRLTERKPNKKFVIDKLPDNYFYARIIRKALPEAFILYCNRDPRDTALSLRFTRFASVRWNLQWDDLIHRFQTYQAISSLSSSKGSENHLIVSYEDLVQNLKGKMKDILDLLGLDWENQCSMFHKTERIVRTASSSQVRKPLYQSSIGRWRNYESYYSKEFQAIMSSDQNILLN